MRVLWSRPFSITLPKASELSRPSPLSCCSSPRSEAARRARGSYSRGKGVVGGRRAEAELGQDPETFARHSAQDLAPPRPGGSRREECDGLASRGISRCSISDFLQERPQGQSSVCPGSSSDPPLEEKSCTDQFASFCRGAHQPRGACPTAARGGTTEEPPCARPASLLPEAERPCWPRVTAKHRRAPPGATDPGDWHRNRWNQHIAATPETRW